LPNGNRNPYKHQSTLAKLMVTLGLGFRALAEALSFVMPIVILNVKIKLNV
jgi:hypothetical protein